MPKWFIFYCEQTGRRSHQSQVDLYMLLMRKSGKIAERWAKEKFSYLGYNMRKVRTGYDFLCKKTDPYSAPGYPDVIYLEVKANLSELREAQEILKKKIEKQGGQYWVIQYEVPYLVAMNLPG